MTRIDEARERLHRLVEEYLEAEAELKTLEGDQFRVCIFGSARIRPEDPTYETVRRLARSLGELGIDIVTGGGPGLMEAANIGVQEAKNGHSLSYGLPIDLPAVREAANKHLDIKSEHRRFSSRLDEFMRLSHAVIVAPGGVGTLLELLYVWQLIQVRLIEPRTIVLLQRSFWAGLLAWMRKEMLGRGFVGPGDLDWVHVVDTPAEALALIRVDLERFTAEQLLRPGGVPSAEQAEKIAERLDEKAQQPEAQTPLPHLTAKREDVKREM
jgi:uncharacterized protein (TIGR00730 family)